MGSRFVKNGFIRSALTACAIVTGVFAIRAPSFVFEISGIDETDFFLMGSSVVSDGIPYVDFVEKKPPAIYWAYATFIQLGASDLYGIHLFTAIWVVLGCGVVWAILKRHYKENGVAVFGAALFGAFSSNIYASTDCETLMNLPTLVAIYFMVLAEEQQSSVKSLMITILSGAAMAVAALFKHQAAVILPAMLIYVAITSIRTGKPGLGRAVALLVGFGLPLLSVVLSFMAVGHLREFIEWNITRNLMYAGEGSPFSFERFITQFALYVVLNALPFWIIAISDTRDFLVGKGLDRLKTMMVPLFWFVIVAVFLGGRFYTHYFFQFVPVYALMAAWPLWTLLRGQSRYLKKFTAFLLIVPVVVFTSNNWARGYIKHNYPFQDEDALAIAEYLSNHSSPDETVYMWGHFSPVYYLSKRIPGSRFINSSTIVGDFDPYHITLDFDWSPFVNEEDLSLLLHDLEVHKPVLFVDSAPGDLHGWSRFPMWRLPALQAYIMSNYVPEAVVSGSVVYRRIEK